MAIVDKTHSQTIEEAFSQVAEGGSGGGSDIGLPVVILTLHNDQSITCDKTYEELMAYEGGAQCIVKAVTEDGTLVSATIVEVGSSYDEENNLNSADLVAKIIYWDYAAALMRCHTSKTHIYENNTVGFSETSVYWSATEVVD